MASSLISRNVTVNGRRTSMRLEADMWIALREIGEREAMSSHQLCTIVSERRRESSLTAAVRVFIMNYFRTAASGMSHEGAMLARAALGVTSEVQAPHALAPANDGVADLRAI